MIYYIKYIDDKAVRVMSPELDEVRGQEYTGSDYATTAFVCNGGSSVQSNPTAYLISFDSAEYARVTDVASGDALAQYICDKLVAQINAKDLRFKADPCWDDVRYAAYYSETENKYISICIQDFDVQDYNQANFVYKSDGEAVEFYRSDYYTGFTDSDEQAEYLCDAVCDLLNRKPNV